MATTDHSPVDPIDVSSLDWGAEAPRGGKAVMGRILKENSTVPLFFGQTISGEITTINDEIKRVSAEDSAILRAVGEGRGYKEIGANIKVTAGAMRARVLRLRRILCVHTGLSKVPMESGIAV